MLIVLCLCSSVNILGFQVRLGPDQRGFPGRVAVQEQLALPVWPVVPGVISLGLEKLGFSYLGKRLLKSLGGRVVPMSLPDAVSPFLLLVHHRHSFTPLDPFRAITNLFLPEGFSAHPHSGFDTLTYCIEGGLRHRCSQGLAMAYGDGDAQWMRAGRGTIHEEMWDIDHGPEKKERFQRIELFQIWLDLPPDYKLVEPRTEILPRTDVPTVMCAATGTAVRVLAGKVFNTGEVPMCVQGPGTSRGIALSPMSVLHVMVPAGKTTDMVMCTDESDGFFNGVCSAFIYIAEGALQDSNGTSTLVTSGNSLIQMWDSAAGTIVRDEVMPARIRLAAAPGDEDLSALILIGEGVTDGRAAKNGPFVARDAETLGKVGRAFSRVNEANGFWRPDMSDSEWRTHVENLDLQEILKQELDLAN